MLKLDNPYSLLEWARDLGKTFTFLDLHVHPYEVLTGDIKFNPDPQIEGLFNKGSFKYHPPTLNAEILPTNSPQSPSDNQRAKLLAARLAYTHTGSKVLTDQIDLAGLSGALLLPVARTAGQAEDMLEASQEMFQKESRLFPGCAIPIGIQPKKLEDFFRSAHKKNNIRAIKFHPNLAGINPLTQKEIINVSLMAAGELHLPMVVHGGRSLGIEPVESTEYGIISRLATINWSISSAPVILAHAGCYDLTYAESLEALTQLSKLLAKHPNLMADVSNLEPPILQLVLKKIEPSRLVFGSDALYVSIWHAWLRFLQALQLVSTNPDDDLIQIASLNPAYCLSLSAAL